MCRDHGHLARFDIRKDHGRRLGIWHKPTEAFGTSQAAPTFSSLHCCFNHRQHLAFGILHLPSRLFTSALHSPRPSPCRYWALGWSHWFTLDHFAFTFNCRCFGVENHGTFSGRTCTHHQVQTGRRLRKIILSIQKADVNFTSSKKFGRKF